MSSDGGLWLIAALLFLVTAFFFLLAIGSGGFEQVDWLANPGGSF